MKSSQMHSKRQMNKNGTEPIVSIEKVVQYAIVVRLWSNHGRKVPQHPRKVPHKQKKALKTNGFQGFDGGDKRDRTADLLNAILNALPVRGVAFPPLNRAEIALQYTGLTYCIYCVHHIISPHDLSMP